MSPPDRGGGGGRGHQPGRDAAVGGGTAMPGAPAHPVTLGCRDARGGHAGGGRDPPGEGEASGGRGDTQHAGDTGGTRPCVAAVGDTGLRGGPALSLGGGRGRGRHPHGHSSPSPTPRGFVPSPLQPRGALSLPGGPHSAAPPACVTPPSQGLMFSRWGKDGARRAGQGLGTLAGSGVGGAGWGPGTLAGSASHEPSAGGWVTIGLGQSPRGSGWVGGGRGVAGAQVGPAKRSA